MSGFELPIRSVPVTFAKGHSLHGLEISFRVNVSTDFYLKVMEWADLISEDNRDSTDTLRDVREAMINFGNHALLGWNLERDGKPVPATGEALAATVDPFTGTDIMARWAQLVGRVPDPLAEPSAPSTTSKTPRPRRRQRR